MGAQRVQRLALLEEINLVQTAVHAGKLSGSTHNLLKGEHCSALILVSYSHGMERCRQCEPLYMMPQAAILGPCVKSCSMFALFL